MKGFVIYHDPKLNVNSLNYGVAEFFLTDLLKPNFHETKLRAFIYPNKVYFLIIGIWRQIIQKLGFEYNRKKRNVKITFKYHLFR